MDLPWATDVSAAAWLADRLVAFGDGIGSVVPSGFEAYARVLHPLDGPERRWAHRAARNGRIAHPEMQLHLISCPPGTVLPDHVRFRGVSVGWLPREELAALAALLRAHTSTPDGGWFGLWDGYGATFPAAALAGPRLAAGRDYVLLRGAVDDVVPLFDRLGHRSPNLWWPDDRAWCVATEIDLAWTYVGGSAAMVEEVLASPDLEALPAQLTDRFTYHDDRLNAALDEH